MILFGIMDPLD